MINKKLVRTIFGVSLILNSIACHAMSAQEDIKIYQRHVQFGYEIEDLATLEEKSDIIVKAKVLPEKKTVSNSFGENVFTEASTVITEVYSGNKKVGDTIRIVEEYTEGTDRNSDKCIYACNLYEPCIADQEYTFFLRYIDNEKSLRYDMYEMPNIITGRYPALNNKVRTISDVDFLDNKDFGLSKGNIASYRNIFQEVADKYMK